MIVWTITATVSLAETLCDGCWCEKRHSYALRRRKAQPWAVADVWLLRKTFFLSQRQAGLFLQLFPHCHDISSEHARVVDPLRTEDTFTPRICCQFSLAPLPAPAIPSSSPETILIYGSLCLRSSLGLLTTRYSLSLAFS